MQTKRLLGVLALAAVALTQVAATSVPGHRGDRIDADGNGYPDEGVVINGHYRSLYAYDAAGGWYWDLGDGRVYGNVGSVDELDQLTLTECDYVVNYRGTFENDPFMDSGTIKNHVTCDGFDGHSVHNADIVHESNPRYRGIPENAIWGSWEYHVDTESGVGNLARPERHVG